MEGLLHRVEDFPEIVLAGRNFGNRVLLAADAPNRAYRVAQVRRNFGKKLYRVGVSDTMALEPVEGLYCVEHVEPSPFGGIVADLRLDADALPHDVIAYINDHYKLAEFHELLPSMNEIFIETVSNTTNTAAQ